MDEIKKYVLTILDEQYSIVSDESETLVLKAAAKVDSLMREVVEKAPSLDKRKVAILAALRISIENERSQQNSKSLDDSLSCLSVSIDRALVEEEL